MNVQSIRTLDQGKDTAGTARKKSGETGDFMEILNRSLKSADTAETDGKVKRHAAEEKDGNLEKKETDSAPEKSVQGEQVSDPAGEPSEKAAAEEKEVPVVLDTQTLEAAAAMVLEAAAENSLQELVKLVKEQTAVTAAAESAAEPDKGTQQMIQELSADVQPAADGKTESSAVENGKQSVWTESVPKADSAAGTVTESGQIKVRTETEPEQQSQEEALKDQAELLKQNAAKPAEPSDKTPTAKAGRQIGVEELQKQVDDQAYMDAGAMAARNLSGTYETPKADRSGAETQPVMEQVQTGMAKGMERGLETFTIRLKPEGLGEILVHLESAGGRTLMSIGVTNAETQKMLNAEMADLKEMLRPLNAEVKEIYQNPSDSFDMMMYQQNMFQQRQQQLYAKMHTVYTGQGAQTEEILLTGQETAAVEPAAYTAGGWNAYV